MIQKIYGDLTIQEQDDGRTVIFHKRKAGKETFSTDLLRTCFKDAGSNSWSNFYLVLMMERDQLENLIQTHERVNPNSTGAAWLRAIKELRSIYQFRFGVAFGETSQAKSNIVTPSSQAQDEESDQMLAFFKSSSHDSKSPWHHKNRKNN
jgi:hypothetical protein